ncbi:hypothetical protein DCC26_03785 [Auritidibacter sp. NML120779]|nr:hypothetical protein DCC26_03785 [Auritidibacter sp. NML120779]
MKVERTGVVEPAQEAYWARFYTGRVDTTQEQPVITVSAVVLRDDQDRVCHVRKVGTQAFMYPGGKPDHGESATETAVREAREELGLQLRVEDLHDWGTFTSVAANEPNTMLRSRVFTVDYQIWQGQDLQPHAEIEELRWIPIDGDDLGLPQGTFLADLATEIRARMQQSAIGYLTETSRAQLGRVEPIYRPEFR